MPEAYKDWKKTSLDISVSILIKISILWFILICSIHYFFQRPLWSDEIHIFKNLTTLDPHHFFTRSLLIEEPIVPRLYLFILQKISKFFDFHLLGLRLLPFLCMLSSFFLWFNIAKHEFKNQLEYLTFILSWSASAALIYYSAELKHYSMDVFATSVFLFFLYHQKRLEEGHRLRYALILILLPILVMLSHMAFLLCWIPLYNLAVSTLKNKYIFRFLLLYAVSLLTFGLLSYDLDLRLQPIGIYQPFLKNYFVSFESFPEFLQRTTEGINNLFSHWFVERPRWLRRLGRIFVFFGFINLWGGFFGHLKDFKKRDYLFNSIHLVAFIIFIELFILGSLRLYPFAISRTVLFFCPVVLFLTVKGIAALENVHPNVHRFIFGFYLFYLVFLVTAVSDVTFNGQLSHRRFLW